MGSRLPRKSAGNVNARGGRADQSAPSFSAAGVTCVSGSTPVPSKVDGKTFAMIVRGALVVKLPRERVAELLASDVGCRFESGGRVMKEWVTIAHGPWVELAREARRFVGG